MSAGMFTYNRRALFPFATPMKVTDTSHILNSEGTTIGLVSARFITVSTKFAIRLLGI